MSPVETSPQFVVDGHLGGYIRRSIAFPHGDWWTWCPRVWDFIAGEFNPEILIDVGCGEGHALRYFSDLGIGAIGIDGMATAQDAGIVPRELILVHDFTTGPPTMYGNVDVVWSCEFVEHVDEQFIDNFLSVFQRAQKAVLMTHATPGQAGHHHVNCQPSEYWIGHMRARGFRVDQKMTEKTRSLAPYTHWERTGVVFVR